MAFLKALFDESTHCYRHPESGVVVPSVTQIIGSCGLVSYNGVRRDILDFKAQLGIEAHRACSYVAQGMLLDEVDERVMPYLQAYKDFADTKNWKPFLVQPEPRIGDLNGCAIGFQPDEVGSLDGVETLLELKCTSDIYPSFGLQLAFYDLLMGGDRRQRRVLQLFPDGKFKLHPYDDRKDYEIVTCLLALHNWKSNHGYKEE